MSVIWNKRGTIGGASAIVVIHYDEIGNESFHVFGGEVVRVFTVDERAPHDRVYEIASRADPATLQELIPKGVEIGHQYDQRHAAVAHAIDAMQRGNRHLSAVPATPLSKD